MAANETFPSICKEDQDAAFFYGEDGAIVDAQAGFFAFLADETFIGLEGFPGFEHGVEGPEGDKPARIMHFAQVWEDRADADLEAFGANVFEFWGSFFWRGDRGGR
jgi:hypothetical protein